MWPGPRFAAITDHMDNDSPASIGVTERSNSVRPPSESMHLIFDLCSTHIENEHELSFCHPTHEQFTSQNTSNRTSYCQQGTTVNVFELSRVFHSILRGNTAVISNLAVQSLGQHRRAVVCGIACPMVGPKNSHW